MNKTTKAEQGRGRGESLEQTEALFRGWRESRKRGARIPMALWAAAVALAERYGVERIAQQLRVDEQRLTKHVQRAGGVVRTGKRDRQFLSCCRDRHRRRCRDCASAWSNWRTRAAGRCMSS
jgi:hypothetical protein